ncbi:MAG: helicase HerA domain-containing protein [Gemmataceae bacterium]
MKLQLAEGLTLPNAILAQHMIVLGKTRSGKSSVLRLFVESLLDSGQRVCVIDPKGDWWGLRTTADGKHAGYGVVIFGGERADVPLTEHAGKSVAELVATGNRPCVIDLGGWMVGERTRFFVEFASTIFRSIDAPLHLVIDEVHNFAPQQKVEKNPDAMKMLHWANRLGSEGAGKGLVLMSASQRPQKVHKDFVTCAETLIAMRVIHKLDRDAMKDWIDGAGDPAKGTEVLNSLAQMARGEGWVWSPEAQFGPQRVKFPMFNTYDSFAAPVAGRSRQALKGWAEVDLEEVKGKLAASIEIAKANDPKELRRRIAELERQQVAKPAAAPTPSPAKVVEVPVLKDGQLTRAEKAADRFELLAGKLLDSATGLLNEGKELRAAIATATRPASAAAIAARPAGTSTPAGPKYVPSKPSPRPSPATSGDRPAKQQAILDALAWLESVRVSQALRTFVAFLSGQSPKSSAFEKHVSELRKDGAIDVPLDGYLQLTPAGRSAASPADAPLTSGALHHAIYSKLEPKQSAILFETIKDYPHDIDSDELAQRTNQSATSSAYEKHLSTLRKLGFIHYPAKGRVAATSVLFLEGA